MRLSVLSLAVLVTACTVAHADIYNFSFTGSDQELDSLGIPNSYSESFSIDTSALVPPTPGDSFYCGNPADNCFVAGTEPAFYIVNRNGLIQEQSEVGLSDSTNLYISSDGGASPLQLFSGSPATPVIATGTFYGYEDSGISYNPEGPIIITDLSAPVPAPEPGTLTLLGTGALGLANLARRRILR